MAHLRKTNAAKYATALVSVLASHAHVAGPCTPTGGQTQRASICAPPAHTHPALARPSARPDGQASPRTTSWLAAYPALFLKLRRVRVAPATYRHRPNPARHMHQGGAPRLPRPTHLRGRTLARDKTREPRTQGGRAGDLRARGVREYLSAADADPSADLRDVPARARGPGP